jgi:hypothetical protein
MLTPLTRERGEVRIWPRITSRTVLKRTLERGNLLVAEATAKEIGRISLGEVLELTLLIAEKEPPKLHQRLPSRRLNGLRSREGRG